jgi:hypothetical protein
MKMAAFLLVATIALLMKAAGTVETSVNITRLHGATSEKIVVTIAFTVRTSSFPKIEYVSRRK